MGGLNGVRRLCSVLSFLVCLTIACGITHDVSAQSIITLPDQYGAYAYEQLYNEALGADSLGETFYSSNVWNYDGGGETAQATATFLPDPSVSVSASVSGPGEQATASIDLRYYFEVLGPPGLTAHLILTASGAVTTPQSSANTAIIYLNGVGVVAICQAYIAVNCHAGSYEGQVPGSSFSISAPVDVATDTVEALDLDVGVVSKTNVGSDTQSGSIDPILTINPSYADASEFQLIFSPGVGNTIPEPSTWTMLLLGFTGLGYVGYARRSRRALAVS